MRKLLSMLLMLMMFVACSNDKDELKEIVLDKGTSTEQIIYSDETSTKEGISFTASENWMAAVTDISTRAAGRVDWLELSQYSGGPGKFTLGITITKNETGSDRKAEIKIVSGGTSITVVVEQKAVTSEEAGKPQAKKKVKSIKGYNYNEESNKQMTGVEDMSLDCQLDFFYDEQGRVVKVDMNDEGSMEHFLFTYKKQDDGNLMIEVTDDVNEEYLYCDNTGKVVKAKTVYENSEHRRDTTYFQYVYDDQSQLIQVTDRDALSEAFTTTDFTWDNHNFVACKSSLSLLGSAKITYSDIRNDGNIDLAYFACFFNSDELLAFPYGVEWGTYTDCFGKRVANMPAKIEMTVNTYNDTYTYTYKRDSEGVINEVYVTCSDRNVKVVIEYMN